MHTISCYGAYIECNFVQDELHIKRNLASDLFQLDFECSGSSYLKKLALNLIITNRCEFPPRDATNLKNGFYLDQKQFGPEIDKNISDKVYEGCGSGDTLGVLLPTSAKMCALQ